MYCNHSVNAGYKGEYSSAPKKGSNVMWDFKYELTGNFEVTEKIVVNIMDFYIFTTTIKFDELAS